MGRISKTQYYLNIAQAVALRATCLRRKYGAIIVSEDQIVATGYCGAPRGVNECGERASSCFREKYKIPSGQRYEMCRSVHAEQNAIINAARAGVSVLTGEMYVYGYDLKLKEACNSYPCLLCLKMAINAGLKRIYYTNPKVDQGYGIIDLKIIVEVWNIEDMFDEREKLI